MNYGQSTFTGLYAHVTAKNMITSAMQKYSITHNPCNEIILSGYNQCVLGYPQYGPPYTDNYPNKWRWVK